MGEVLGISEEQGARRNREPANHCLWCNEFFMGVHWIFFIPVE